MLRYLARMESFYTVSAIMSLVTDKRVLPLVLQLINSITWWYVIVGNLMGFIFLPLKANL